MLLSHFGHSSVSTKLVDSLKQDSNWQTRLVFLSQPGHPQSVTELKMSEDHIITKASI